MKYLFLCLSSSLMLNSLVAQSILTTDSLHSQAPGKTEKYQIYLPNGYTQNTNQRYPVGTFNIVFYLIMRGLGEGMG